MSRRTILMVTLVLSLPGVALGQRPAEAPGDVQDLLQRLEAVEKKRAQIERPARSAAPDNPQTAASPPPTQAGTALLVWGLLVAAVIVVATVLIRRFRPTGISLDDAKALQLVESIWVGRGQRVILVRVRHREVLIGASGSHLSSLAVLGPDEVPKGEERAAGIPGIATRADAQEFVALVEEELNEVARGSKSLAAPVIPSERSRSSTSSSPLRAKQQILRRLNDI